jgi:hypothetical protein
MQKVSQRPNSTENADKADEAEIVQDVYFLRFANGMREMQEGLAERGGFDPATKEPGRPADGPVKQERGCSDDSQTYSIAKHSNCRSKGNAMRTAEINDFGGKTKSTFCCRNSD